MKNFSFPRGYRFNNTYKVLQKLGEGVEGETYLVQEVDTQIERAAKFFYPAKRPQFKQIRNYAKKLHKLRTCNSLIKYISKEEINIENRKVICLFSDFIDGITLETYLYSYHPLGMYYYQALRLFYDLVCAVEEIHFLGDYHGDLHSENIMIQRIGLRFDIKLIDVYWGSYDKKSSLKNDIYQLTRILYGLIGGSDCYKNQPDIIKFFIAGGRRKKIEERFKTITQLKLHLESLSWEV